MQDIIVRKCHACKNTIEINRSGIEDVIYYNRVYYHKKCFCELAEKRSQSKRGNPTQWEDALNNLESLEIETQQMLKNAWSKDDLNEWLLLHYDITAVPSRFWQMAADLERGIYKGKRCKAIKIDMLLSMWKWGQKRLDSIALKNQTSQKGPKNDTDRIMYDLAILIGHTNDYIKHINGIKAAEIERKNIKKEEVKVDYCKIKTSSNNQGLDDISDLLDDLI